MLSGLNIEAAAPVAGAAMVLTLLGRAAVQWIRSRAGNREVDADLQKHWTEVTLQLVDELREELGSAKAELAALRPILTTLGHFEESLDHLHALLAALRTGTTEELSAAVRRAEAFLRRMRGDDAKGETRQAVQTLLSAQRIVKDQTRD